MNHLSPLGWITLGCFGVFFIALNMSLLLLYRNRNAKIKARPPRTLNPFQRDPWEKENAGWKQLSEQVERLKKEQGAAGPHRKTNRPAASRTPAAKKSNNYRLNRGVESR